MFNLEGVSRYLSQNDIDAWLIYDFKGSNPIMSKIIGKKSATRRTFLLITKTKEIYMVCHIIDKEQFEEMPVNAHLIYYTSWEDLNCVLNGRLNSFKRVAMEYSPNCSIPNVSIVDAGTVELVKQFDVEVVSSADIFQIALAAWTDASYESHIKACAEVEDIKNVAFRHIKESINNDIVITEYDIQQLILDEFKKRGMETEDSPVVAVNENSGNPHYEPSIDNHTIIKKGDIVMIDLWAKFQGDENVFADITWMGYVGKTVPEKYVDVFNIVKGARDAVISHLSNTLSSKSSIQGWEADKVARDYISKHGYEKNFIHRTGHSIGPGNSVHAIGVNIDNFETHDTRSLLPRVGFSIEPGIYLKDFGVRTEINVYCDEQKGFIVTTSVQDEILLLG